MPKLLKNHQCVIKALIIKSRAGIHSVRFHFRSNLFIGVETLKKKKKPNRVSSNYSEVTDPHEQHSD